jgi:hypothetical protein
MFNSSIPDVVVGLVFSFLALSLATGAVVEAISSILQLRAKTLQIGISQILNDPNFSGLAKAIYGHAAVNPRGPGGTDPTKNRPAYIDPFQFANALMDLTGIAGAAAQPAANQAETVQVMKAEVHKKTADPQLSTLLTGIIERTVGDPARVRQELAAWFDNGMDRLSGDYKRWSQYVSVVVALLLAVSLNVDAVHIEKALWAQPAIAAQIKADPKLNPDQAMKAMNATLPIGWSEGFLSRSDGTRFETGDWVNAIIGWILAALATLFGAPFWFDVLQAAVRVRSTGPSPADKVKWGEKTVAT